MSFLWWNPASQPNSDEKGSTTADLQRRKCASLLQIQSLDSSIQKNSSTLYNLSQGLDCLPLICGPFWHHRMAPCIFSLAQSCWKESIVSWRLPCYLQAESISYNQSSHKSARKHHISSSLRLFRRHRFSCDLVDGSNKMMECSKKKNRKPEFVASSNKICVIPLHSTMSSKKQWFFESADVHNIYRL